LKNESHKLLAISSAVKGEGKTITSLNLATVIAKDFGQKVLLIDGDLKKPDLHSYLHQVGKKGLVDILLGKAALEDCMIPFLFENLFVLPVGTRYENSSRLLNMPKMGETLAQLAKEFDYVIIDTPPVLPLADMNIFSNLVDGILLVVRAGKTPRDLVRKAKESLPSQKVLGIILNDMEINFTKYYGYPY
jgi:capsular exopolysaccharide synthesis family protein